MVEHSPFALFRPLIEWSGMESSKSEKRIQNRWWGWGMLTIWCLNPRSKFCTKWSPKTILHRPWGILFCNKNFNGNAFETKTIGKYKKCTTYGLLISEVTGLHSLIVNSDTWRPSESTKGNCKFENSSFQCIITSKTRARRGAEFPAEGMLRYRIQRQGLPIGIGWNWREASYLPSLVLWIAPHLASFLFTCARHFSAHRSSSQAIPVFSILFTTLLLNSSSFFHLAFPP